MADKDTQELDDIEIGPKPKKWLLPVVALVMAAVGAGGGYFLASSSASASEGAAAEAGGEEGGAAAEDQAPEATDDADLAVTSLGNFTVNLRDAAGSRMLQMEVALETPEDLVEKVTARQAALRDAIILLASDFSSVELEGMDGKLRLRDEVQRRVDAVLAPDKVNRVYFTAFVVQ